jgi:hypothetical protein
MVQHGTQCMNLGLWMVRKGNLCTDWDGGCIQKVPGVWYGLWILLLESAKDGF